MITGAYLYLHCAAGHCELLSLLLNKRLMVETVFGVSVACATTNLPGSGRDEPRCGKAAPESPGV